jgi:(R,R)-butanediol dehydrogenase/meso-butanediol dehydrogenase/diacetyl reductase
MKAARLYGKEDIRIDNDVKLNDIGSSDVQIDVEVCGICGSDLHEYADPEFTPINEHPKTGANRPIVIGHEFSGVVSKVGNEVNKVTVGDAVAVHPNIPCQDCVYCEDGDYNRCMDTLAVGFDTGAGGFAESAVVPAQQVHLLPDKMDLWKGALVEPFAVGFHAVRRSGMKAGDSIGVFGCGPIGLTVIQAAQFAGAKKIFISEPNDRRRKLAQQMGADVALDPVDDDVIEIITDATEDGVNIAFEFAGIGAAFNTAVQSTRRGGIITVGSISKDEIMADLDSIVMAERTIRGTYCYGFPPSSFRTEFDAVIDALAEDRIETEVFVTNRVPLEKLVENGFDQLLGADTEHGKILVEP